MKPEMEKMKRGRRREEEAEEEKWVHDASVDHKGRIPLRASTGVWKASLLVLTIEFSEKVSYFAIATNLITYLTQVMLQDLETAAKNVNYWLGTTALLPLIGGFVADAYSGRYYMILFSSFISLMGLSLLTMSQYISSLKPCNVKTCHGPSKVHEVVFFLGLYCISVGAGGHKPCLESFGADQFDDDHLEEKMKKMSFFNWWTFVLCFATLLGVTVVVYVQDNVSWGVANLGLACLMAFTVTAFFVGKSCYRYRRPKGNPFISILQVLIAAMRKRNLLCPSNPALLYQGPTSDELQQRLLSHTSRLRFLDKAAITEECDEQQNESSWRLATVTRVEETKLILNVIPIWLSSITFAVCSAQSAALSVKQAAATDLHITTTFKIPPASLSSIRAVTTLIVVPIYDRILVPTLRKLTGNERGISILRRIGIGFAFVVIAMVVAALVETHRLGSTVAVRVFWLVPQNVLIGLGDAFTSVGLQEYFYDQVPDSMRSLGIALYLSVIGMGCFMSSFLIIIVNYVTGKKGRKWIGKDINSSRLDLFYWLVAGIHALNLCVYVWVAKRYTYKTLQKRVAMEVDDCKEDGVETMA